MEFARKVRQPRNLQRRSPHWFINRIVDADDTHARAFASEVLTATVIVGCIVQVLLKFAGLLLRSRMLRSDAHGVRLFQANLATLLHKSLFSELYPRECQKPKLH